MNYMDKPVYTTKDFTRGQEVYLRIIPGSNMARHFGLNSTSRLDWGNPPELDEEYISQRIVTGVVSTVGRKYLTVDMKRGYDPVVKFDMDNCFYQSVDSGTRDFEVFTSRKEAEDDIRFEYYYQCIHFGFLPPNKYTFGEVEQIYNAMFKKSFGLHLHPDPDVHDFANADGCT